MNLLKHLGQQPLGCDKVSGIKSSREVLLDFSVVTLCLSLFQWASYKEEKGASAYSHETTTDDKDDTIELVTNNAHLSATQVCKLYRSRWNIESFFKTIKQNLRIKSFLGTNKNAVMSQIWCAMIALLLLRHLKANAKFPWYMSNLVSLIRLAMFSTIQLTKWLDNPLCLTQEGPENVAIDTS